MTAVPTTAINRDGWLAAATAHNSRHRHRRADGDGVRLVVIHGISLPAGVFGGDDIIRLFTDTLDCDSRADYAALRDLRVSAHFLIRRDGALLQFVSCDDVAYHAGVSCWRGAAQCNDFSLGIELEGTDTVAYENAQYESLIALLGTLIKFYPNIKISGHQHIAPGRKTDPGDSFDWARLFTAIGEHYDGRNDS